MSKTTWRDVLRDDPSDPSPPTPKETALMMRAAFLQAAGYPEAVRRWTEQLKEEHS